MRFLDFCAIHAPELLEMMGEGVVYRLLDGTIVATNNVMAALTGYTTEEIQGMNIAQILAPESLELAMERQRSLPGGETISQRYEIVLIHKNGERRTGESVIRLISEQGHPIGVLALVRDITERKEAEQALRESEERYRQLVEMSPDAIYIRSGDTIVFINAAGARLLGAASPEEVVGKPSGSFIHPEYEEIAKRRARHIEETGRTAPLLEEKFIRLDGQVIDVEVGGSPIPYRNRLAVQVIVRDITERKRVEQQLRESESRLRKTLDSMLEGCQIIGFDWRYLYLNDTAEKLGRRSGEERLGRTMMEIYPDIEGTELFARLRRSMEERLPQRFETEFAFPDGVKRWFEIDVQPVPEGISMLSLDITERKHRQQTMESYIMQTIRAQEEERKRLARELHDETVQALSVLMFDIERLIRAGERLPKRAIQSLELLRDNTGRIAEEVSRLSHALRPGILDQLGLVQAVEVLTQDLRKVSGVAAQVEVAGQERRLPSEVEVGLFRIVQEALNNVRRHSGAAQSVVRIEFGPEMVRASVSDDGRGFRLPQNLADLAMNGDLGLMGMQERAQLLKGTLHVWSEVGKGTTVSVEVGC